MIIFRKYLLNNIFLPISLKLHRIFKETNYDEFNYDTIQGIFISPKYDFLNYVDLWIPDLYSGGSF
jgi:hypothetical protein